MEESADRRAAELGMDIVNLVGLSRSYEDVSRVEKLRRSRRGGKLQYEYQPTNRSGKTPPNGELIVDTFELSEHSE